MQNFLNTKKTAEYMSMSESWLRKQRCYGMGPIFTKLGKSVRYRKEDIDAYLLDHQQTNTINRQGEV